ncbi:Uu.00g049400.m01.CDS01 [Anthostomella pinea]|uniref:Uu.00g049400.m01.CDS01 n=1 Tax=Anthostomella pinea TaxID=933095 RepID=A0AAI8VCF7_9PEZI|nr:Uu.00g049400.m01.CDS01 [Anthostomella pinea]
MDTYTPPIGGELLKQYLRFMEAGELDEARKILVNHGIDPPELAKVSFESPVESKMKAIEEANFVFKQQRQKSRLESKFFQEVTRLIYESKVLETFTRMNVFIGNVIFSYEGKGKVQRPTLIFKVEREITAKEDEKADEALSLFRDTLRSEIDNKQNLPEELHVGLPWGLGKDKSKKIHCLDETSRGKLDLAHCLDDFAYSYLDLGGFDIPNDASS